MPSGAPAWRQRVAAATGGLRVGDGVRLAFALPPQRWVDLDTLVETSLAGLRDAGALRPRYAGLDAVLATRANSDGTPGVAVSAASAAAIRRGRPPGDVSATVTAATVPLPGDRAGKRHWRDRLAVAWAPREPLTGPVWTDVRLALATAGSLLRPLEVVLDALEPVLGRDPRGRDWQEFFPNDHLIEWLRVRRARRGPALTLRLGPLQRR